MLDDDKKYDTSKVYLVRVPELHWQTWEVYADDPEEAKERVRDGDGVATSFEYSHTIDHIPWEVEPLRRE